MSEVNPTNNEPVVELSPESLNLPVDSSSSVLDPLPSPVVPTADSSSPLDVPTVPSDASLATDSNPTESAPEASSGPVASPAEAVSELPPEQEKSVEEYETFMKLNPDHVPVAGEQYHRVETP